MMLMSVGKDFREHYGTFDLVEGNRGLLHSLSYD